MRLSEIKKKPTPYQRRKLRKDFKESLAYAESMIEEFPERRNNYMFCHYFNMISKASDLGDERLLNELEYQLEILRPGDGLHQETIVYNRALLHIKQGKVDDALAILKPIADSEQHTSYKQGAIGIMIDYYVEKSDFKSAAPYVHRYMSTWDDDHKNDGPKSYLNYAGLPQLLEYLGLAGEYENVINIGKEIIEVFGPDDAYLLHLIGQSYLELKDDLRALHYLSQALQLEPGFAEIYVNLGAFYWNEKNDFKSAINYMEKAAAICEKDPSYNKLAAIVYRNLANLHKLCLDMDTAADYRRKQFEAMDSLFIFDLIALFGSDKESMSEFRIWAENHPEAYGENTEDKGNDDEDFWEDRTDN